MPGNHLKIKNQLVIITNLLLLILSDEPDFGLG